MQKGKQFLSDLKLHSDYFKWVEEAKRYETWEEACDSIVDGHREHYKDIKDTKLLNATLNFSVKQMKEKRILASQRNLQFRAPQVEKNNAKLYNCSSMYAARNEIFQEVFFLALSGCGVGVGLLMPFVDNISNIKARDKGTLTYVIEDSIEGWADSLGVLMSSYFVDKQPFPEYAGHKIKFDFSKIRPRGSFISGGFKAPGPEGLQASLEKIEKLLDNWIVTEGEALRPIAVFDIICHAADAVLSGGVRRSALNMIVDPNDAEMIAAKTGNWRQENPQRARSNNSVLLLRRSATEEGFKYLVELNEGDSDIGFVFGNSWFDMFNPCFEILKIPIYYKGDLEAVKYADMPDFVKKYSHLMGVAFCNLTEINAEAAKTKEEFLQACKAAAVIGTMQAGYTSFPYLGPTTEKIVRREALLGVSITGWMNNPDLFDPELLEEGAETVKKVNKAIAKLIGINQAARTTCVDFCAL